MSNSHNDPFDEFRSDSTPQPKRRNYLMWILGSVGICCVLCCGGAIAFVAYVGVVAPETSVYTGSQIPAKFTTTAKDVGALEDGESIEFFYSDGILDIRDGFYFVSDRKVAVYSEDGRDPALQTIKFEDIDLLEFSKSTGTFEDSEIMMKLKDGQWITFPVSNEHGRDQLFFDAINDKRPLPDQPAERE